MSLRHFAMEIGQEIGPLSLSVSGCVICLPGLTFPVFRCATSGGRLIISAIALHHLFLSIFCWQEAPFN